jgi:hypothetical protein
VGSPRHRKGSHFTRSKMVTLIAPPDALTGLAGGGSAPRELPRCFIEVDASDKVAYWRHLQEEWNTNALRSRSVRTPSTVSRVSRAVERSSGRAV